MSQLKHKQRSVEDISKLPIVGKKPKTEKEEKFLREVCEYEFINVEERGATHRFSYGNASNQHVFTFDHGKKYKLPRFIAEHVESRQTPIWDWRPDGTGAMNKQLTGQNPRFQMRQKFSF